MEEILQIAATWSPWDNPTADTVPRKVDLPAELRPSLALVIQGVRRCGKSTLMRQLVAHYGFDPRRCLFLNFEDPRLASALDFRTLDAVVDAFERQHGDQAPLHFFFDEIQWVEGWERWMRSRLDRANNQTFVVSGSNARLLSGELGSTLTGRHLTIELYPFDFHEFRCVRPDASFSSWLEAGGFPEPAGMDDGDRLLRQYFSDIVERDVRERVGARSGLALRRLVQNVFEAAGSELSLRRIAASQGIAVETAASWLEACRDAYLLFACPWFAWSERKRATRNVKYYPIDTGLRRVTVTPTGADRGKALECAVHLELRRRFTDIFYWRGEGEVDFVVLNGSTPIPIQVSWDGPKERHERALDAFYEAHPQSGEAVHVSAVGFHEALAELAAGG